MRAANLPNPDCSAGEPQLHLELLVVAPERSDTVRDFRELR
jgi:hypothetical protein